MATLPHREAEGLASWLSQLLGVEIVPTSNFLNLTLGNPGQVIHPGLMYGLFADWNGATYQEDNIPRFYADATDKTGVFVDALSREIIAVARRIEESSAGNLHLTGVLAIHEWLRLSYPTQIGDASTIATSFRTLAHSRRGNRQCGKSPRGNTYQTSTTATSVRMFPSGLLSSRRSRR
jgi:hypothetical protein